MLPEETTHEFEMKLIVKMMIMVFMIMIINADNKMNVTTTFIKLLIK